MLILLGSCGRFQAKPLPLPPTPSIAGDMGWILVKESYARLKVKAGEASVDLGHLRDGTILEVRGRTLAQGRHGDGLVYWYLVDGESEPGWISSEDVELSASREQAQYLAAKARSP